MTRRDATMRTGNDFSSSARLYVSRSDQRFKIYAVRDKSNEFVVAVFRKSTFAKFSTSISEYFDYSQRDML